jgi:cobalt-zinc-cadmium efflux system protein
MAYDHAHRQGSERRLALVLGLAATYMMAEAIGGWLTNSLALLADAGHMLSDVGALGLSLFAVWVARRPSNARFTYGYYRTEILAALANGAALVAIAIVILLEAWQRLGQAPEVNGGPMLAIASGGLVVNLIGLAVLHGGKDQSLNLRGAWSHVLADALGSVGAMTAGALVWGLGWNWADPAASVVIALLVVYASFSLLREAVAVLMEGAPGHLDVDEIRSAIAALESVGEVHDLHVWTITSGVVSLSCHAVAAPASAPSDVLGSMRALLRQRFGIDHVTIQIEPDDPDSEACEDACEEGDVPSSARRGR